MSSGSPARAFNARPTGRLVFRPFEPRHRRKSTTPPPPPPPPPTTTRSSTTSPNVLTTSKPEDDNYGIDFDLDDEDAQAIEEIFAEYNEKLKIKEHDEPSNEKDDMTSPSLVHTAKLAKSEGNLHNSTLQQQQPPIHKQEEEHIQQDEYHDSLALDQLLDLEFDDAELLEALVSQELPSSQKEALQKQPEPREDWDGDDIDKQVLREYEQWLKETNTNEVSNQAIGISRLQHMLSIISIEDELLIWGIPKRLDLVDETPNGRNQVQREEKQRQEVADQRSDHDSIPQIEEAIPDTRSPLDRFKSRGNKPKLSVSDLLFNMWCEQQYHYSLLRGFKRRTAEMQAGTKIHRQMEEEVHTIVPVTVKTEQDKWGIRIWNMIQGLESLRTTGLTRELEVWGWLEGVFINGVIDEVTYTKYDHGTGKEQDPGAATNTQGVTDVSMETNISNANSAATVPAEESASAAPTTPTKRRGRSKKTGTPTPDQLGTPQRQTTILDFITPSPKRSRNKGTPAYVLDLKTRFSRSIPEPGSSQSKSVHLQLMLYRQLLNDMVKATPKSMVRKLCEHHKLAPDERFSDDLVAELAGIGDTAEGAADDLTLLLENNSIEKLYSLYHKKLKQTISTVAPELTVVYRWQQNGEFLEAAGYMADDVFLKEHVDSVITWWKGKRKTIGVEVDEAWKCNKCEFNEHCTWRLGKIEEARDNQRRKRRLGM